ncbi:MAG: hypothetical protein JSR55_08305 [Proteobacteria bacterium]|nr:hypothetical protein [Pseudomonadota bacterium]
MTRLAILGSVCLVSLACVTLPACGQQNETQRILAQCSNPPPDQIDACIEQARVQQEADPSPELKDLIASLLRREADASNQPQSLQPSLPPADDTGAYDTPPTPPPSPDLDSSSAYDPPPDMPPPQDVAPPAGQGNPAAADQGDDDDSPPPPPGSGEQNPAPHDSGGPGRA